MNTKLTYIALMLYALCYALLFGTWAAIVFNKVPGADQIVTYIQIGLGTLSGHVLTLLGSRPAADSPAPTAQAGFASAGMMLIIAVLAAGAMSLTGCAIMAPGAPTASPRQVLAQVCPAMKTSMSALVSLQGMPQKDHELLFSAQPIVDSACDSAGAVDFASLQAISETAIPALLKMVNAAPLDPDTHDQLVLGLTLGQIMLAGALQAATPVAP